MRHREHVQISAHRCGAGGDIALENTRVALEQALTMGAEYVEFDVQRCGDGALVLFHDDWMWVEGERRQLADLTFAEFASRAPHFLRYDEVLRALSGRAKAHIDLKFTSPSEAYADPSSTWEVTATRRAVDLLGEDNMIVTTLDDKAVRAVRDWSDLAGVELLVGLSLGRRVRGLPFRRQVRIRLSELLPRLRYRESRANLVVCKHTLARLGVARFARRLGLPLLVWTVDTPGSLHYWMKPGRAWLVTSNHPELALDIREQRTGRRTSRGRHTGGHTGGHTESGSERLRA